MRERERQASTAADAAAVRVHGLEAALADLRASADAPEAELRSRAAEVRQALESLLPSPSENARCTSAHVKRRGLLVVTGHWRRCTMMEMLSALKCCAVHRSGVPCKSEMLSHDQTGERAGGCGRDRA